MENMPKTLEELLDLITIASDRSMKELNIKGDVKILCALAIAGVMSGLKEHITGVDPFTEDELMRAHLAGMLTREARNGGAEITYEDLKNYVR